MLPRYKDSFTDEERTQGLMKASYVVLVIDFYQLDIINSHQREGNFNRENASFRLGCRAACGRHFLDS